MYFMIKSIFVDALLWLMLFLATSSKVSMVKCCSSISGISLPCSAANCHLTSSRALLWKGFQFIWVFFGNCKEFFVRSLDLLIRHSNILKTEPAITYQWCLLVRLSMLGVTCSLSYHLLLYVYVTSGGQMSSTWFGWLAGCYWHCDLDLSLFTSVVIVLLGF